MYQKTKQLWKDFVALTYTKIVSLCAILTDSGEKFEEKFGTLTPELERLCQQLCLHHVKEVAL
jgi:transposase